MSNDQSVSHRSRSPWFTDRETPDRSKPSAVKTPSAPVQSAPASVTTDVSVPAPAPVPVREGAGAGTNLLRRSLAAIWRTRAVWLGPIGVACALYGQKLVTDGKEQAVVLSMRWYTAGIILVLIAWAGTYKNKSLLRLPDPSVEAGKASANAQSQAHMKSVAWRSRVVGWLRASWRYLLAFAALGFNLFSVSQLRADYSSAVGGWGWLASLVLLLAAFIGHRPNPGLDADASVQEVEDRTDLRIPRKLEIAIFLAIFALALLFRLYRIDDLTAGMHGDEGEFGLDAIAILSGTPISPFKVGSFAFSNFTFWSLAIAMKVFGINLLGLRIFSTLIGTLMIIPFYLLVRMWFGVRTAIIASLLLSISDIAVFFSKLALNNIETAFSLVAGFYFLFRGLHTRRTINFVLSGLAFMFFSLYFYYAGRLTPVLVLAVLAYLFVLIPLMRLPGAYLDLRRNTLGLNRLLALGQALRTQTLGIVFYSGQLLILAITCISVASPFLAYEADHPQDATAHSDEKLIFNHPDYMAAQYKATHAPLYFGVRLPKPDDTYPMLPGAFEQAPLSVKLTDDGFWLRVLWGQTTATLSVLTLRPDTSTFVAFLSDPVAKPIEAVLIILGIAWAAWRWRDTRMAVMSMWFWSTVLAGGVLTAGAPYMPRMVGIIPVMAIFAAVPLNKLTAEFAALVRRLRPTPVLSRRSALAFGTLALLALLGYLGAQNWTDYYDRYSASYPHRSVGGAAYFVRQMNKIVTDEKRPTPQYYDLGMHYIYWTHGVNAFLNYGTEGSDMTNPSSELPILNNGGRDVVFLIWDVNKHYLPIIKQYYPDGEEGSFSYGPERDKTFLFTYYRVKREQIEARRYTSASYTDANGSRVERHELALGSSETLPSNLHYPVVANWSSNLIAPAFAHYRFRLEASGESKLVIDGLTALSIGSGQAESEGDVILARGSHSVQLTSTIPSKDGSVRLHWTAGDSPFSSIDNHYLWSGPGQGLLGTVRAYNAQALENAQPDQAGANDQVLERREDGFVGFRHSPDAMTRGAPLSATWTGTISITQTGVYTFEVFSNGGSVVLIDGRAVVDNRQPDGTAASKGGDVELVAGTHHIEVRYAWKRGPGYLELFWTPPGAQKSLVGPDVLHTDSGAWLPGTIEEPPAYQLPPEPQPK